MMSNTTKKLAVIIAAYKAGKYIMETVKSLKNQKVPQGWTVKFFIGVDGCKNTAEVLKENKIPFYFSEKNIGTYVMANSLIYEAKKIDCDMFLRFDADDIANENFIFNGINHCVKMDFIRTCYNKANLSLKIIDKKSSNAWGIVFFTKEILEKFGGYKQFRVDCDYDLIHRLLKIDYKGIIKENKPIFTRRMHSDSLSQSKETNGASQYRRKVKGKMSQERRAKGKDILVKNPVRTELEFIM